MKTLALSILLHARQRASGVVASLLVGACITSADLTQDQARDAFSQTGYAYTNQVTGSVDWVGRSPIWEQARWALIDPNAARIPDAEVWTLEGLQFAGSSGGSWSIGLRWVQGHSRLPWMIEDSPLLMVAAVGDGTNHVSSVGVKLAEDQIKRIDQKMKVQDMTWMERNYFNKYDKVGSAARGIGSLWGAYEIYDGAIRDSGGGSSATPFQTDGERATIIVEKNAALHLQDGDQTPNLIIRDSAVVDLDLSTEATILRNEGL